MTEVYREFGFEAAHLLPNVPEGHKCRRLHGHSYRVRVYVEGPVDDRSGMVVDFADISDAFAPLERDLDHRYLNEVEGLENPTSENVARWIWMRLSGSLRLSRVVVAETCASGVDFRGEGSR